jgi:hypothetical protein
MCSDLQTGEREHRNYHAAGEGEMLRKVGVPVFIAVRGVVCLEAGFRGRHFEVHFVEDHPGWCVVEDHKGCVEQKHVGKRPDV